MYISFLKTLLSFLAMILKYLVEYYRRHSNISWMIHPFKIISTHSIYTIFF